MFSVVYYESIKRELKIKSMYECRCYERLQTKTKEFTRLPYAFIRKGKKWGLSLGKGLVRVFRNPLKRIILPLSKAGHMQTLVGERWSFERRVSHPRWNLQQVSGFSLLRTNHFYNMWRVALSFGEMRCGNKDGPIITRRAARKPGVRHQNVLSPHQVGA